MIYNTEVGLQLKTNVEDVTHGQGFADLVKAFEDISMKRPEGCNELAVFMRDKFNTSVVVKVVSGSAEYKFYGFRAFPYCDEFTFPSPSVLLDWGKISKWVIEIDDRLTNDYSKRINAKDMAVLFLYWIETNFANVTLSKRIEMLEKEIFCEGRVDHALVSFLYAPKPNPQAHAIIALPRLYRCFWVNFETNLKNDSMLIRFLEADYRAALNKLIAAYGTYGLINRKLEEFDANAKSIIYWVFESVNDLRYSCFRFRKNMTQRIVGCMSPTAKMYMIHIYKNFTDKVTHVFAEESAFFDALHPQEKTPQRKALDEANIEAHWKKQLKIAFENANFKYLDDKGWAKPVDTRELDEIRVGIQDIDSVEDKVFLLERLHEQLGRLDNALSMLEDKKLAHKVKQNKSELLKRKDEMELIRQMIFKAPVGKMRYGLFIKYPQGYEG